MKTLSTLRIVFAALFRRSRVEGDMEEELRSHIADRADDLMRTGVPRDEAMRRARIEFGGYQKYKEEIRETVGAHFMETLLQDIRYAARMLRKSPGFTAVAVLTLALSIGANTAIFSAVYGVLLAPLPYANASRLVVLNETTPKVGIVSVSHPNFLDWRKQSQEFSEMCFVHSGGFNLAGVTQPENINGDEVSPNFLSMLGVRPFLGRDFDPSEEKSGTAPVLLLSYQLWQSHFGGDRNAIGRSITLNGRNFTIIGVLPPNYRDLDASDVLLPLGVWITGNSDEVTDRGNRGDATVIGRLAPGATFSQALAEMKGIAARLAKQYPASNDQFGVELRTIRDVFVGDMRPALLVLFAAVLFVLLIACANVANLFLVRGAARTKEIALRIAFGASRGRIIRQMLTESLVLAALGGALGLLLAILGIRGMDALIPTDALSGAAITLNSAVLLFAAGIVIVCVFIFGLAPAMHFTRPDVQSELKEGARTVSGGTRQNRLRTLLATAEISLALILLTGAGLMMKSLYRLLSVNPGFQTDRVLTMEMDLRTQQYAKDPAILNFWQQLLERVRALPGIQSAALGTHIPLTGSHGRTDITIEGMSLPSPGKFPHPDYHTVSPQYVATLGVTLLRGRTFSDADTENAPLVAMINAKLAAQYFPGQNPIGKRLMFGHPDPSGKNPPKWRTIVGEVGDTKLYGLANPARLEVYIPYRQDAENHMDLLVKSRVDPAALLSSIRSVVASIDKNQPIFAISSMDQLRTQSVGTQRTTLILLAAFSALALVLAAIGIYGVIAYSVSQRTHEIGIRMALGAQHRDVLRMVLSQGGKIALTGIIIGTLAALALTRLMSSLLFAVSASDPLTFTAVALVLGTLALLACYIPARRATKVDPMVALRYE